MSSVWGERLKISLFGESHGPAIGVVIDGLPAGERIDEAELAAALARRAPGKSPAVTARRETDTPEFLSGLINFVTTGAPLCIVIRNQDAHSGDYAQFSHIPRPGHADFTAGVRYSGFCDYRGGGHFSGRLTAPLAAAGNICAQILARRGVTVGAHLFSCAGISDAPLDPAGVTPEQLAAMVSSPFPVIDSARGAQMLEKIAALRAAGDSAGGVVECAASGVAPGLGGPFVGVESVISSLLFAVPGVKGVEFGSGFAAAGLTGSSNNDAFECENGRVVTETNNHGGILGGITSGMPVIVRAAFKPTPSIAVEQQSVDLDTMTGTRLSIKGRHDPCIAVRAVPVVEAAVSTALLELYLEGKGYGA